MPQVSSALKLSGKKLVQPQQGTRSRTGLANAYWNPLGPEPGHCWVLLPRSDLDAIKGNATHTLSFTRYVSGESSSGTSIEVSPLYLLRTQRLRPGGPDSDSSIHLVELVDRRWLANWSSVNASYNVRSYAQDETDVDGRYLTESLNGGSAWTWVTMLTAIWPGIMGAFPGLPYSPDGIPEDYRFYGVSAWQAAHEVLARLGCTSAYDPTANTFSIVRLGAAQATPAYPDPPFWDAEIQDHGSTKEAATIRVFFHDHEQNYGQESDVELGDNWSIKPPLTSSDVASGVTNAVGSTVRPTWSDLAREFDENGNDNNSGDRANRASDIATSYGLDAGTERKHLILPGLVSVTPGGQVRAVMWRHWGDRLVTEVVHHPGLPARPDSAGLIVPERYWPVREILAPPDLGRHSFANYPRLLQDVQVWDTGESDGAFLEANSNGLHPGRVRRIVAGTMETFEDCWVRFIDDHDDLNGQVPSLNGEHYLGRLTGVYTHGGSTKPLYLCKAGCCIKECQVLTYSYTGTQTYTGSDQDLPFDSEDQTGSIFTVSSGVITVNGSGPVEVELNHSAQVSGGSPGGDNGTKVRAQEASGGSYSDVPLSSYWIAHPNAGAGEGSGNKHFTWNTANGDTIKATVTRSGGSDTLATIANQSFIRIKPGCGFKPINQYVGLIACFEPTGSAGDDQTNTVGIERITLVDTGDVGRGTGKVSTNSWVFDGSADRFDVSSFPEIDMSGEWSISSWVKADAFGGGIVMQINNSAQFLGAMSLQTSNSPSNHFILVSSSDDGVATVAESTKGRSTGTWYHVTATHDGSGNIELFVNGASEGTGSTGGTTNMDNGTESLALGWDGSVIYFDGELDGFRMYDRLQSDPEITALYNSGTGNPCG